MLRRALVLAAIAFSAGCASQTEEAPVTTASLEGAYHAELGPYAWTSFLGDSYIAVVNSMACNGATPADACIERGTFVFDSRAAELRLRTEAGIEKTLPIVVNAVEARGALTTSSTQLVQGQRELVSPNVVTSFSLVQKQEQLVQEAELRKIMIICRVVGLVLNPPSAPVIVPPTPPPIVQTQQCAGASAKG
ncbi:MAG: hypothetical protein JST00_20125 [Deltaproteobacteria bacterium]|nr:hypothetical protein [Deltaproteobacteria bacterium]